MWYNSYRDKERGIKTMYYNYDPVAFDREIRKERRIESRTDKIENVYAWRASSHGSVSISYASSSSIYDCITEACGSEIAENFFRNF